MRIELAQCGTVLIHWFAYIKDAPQCGKDSNDDIAAFYDITYSLDIPDNCKLLIQYQLHIDSKYCKTGVTHKCYLGFPVLPMSRTMILEPIDITTFDEQLKFYRYVEGRDYTNSFRT